VAETNDSLLQLVDTVRRRWVPLLLITLVILAGTIWYAETRPDEYQASAIVSVTPRPDKGGADLVRVGAPKYAAYISAASTLRAIAPRLGEPPRLLLAGVDAEVAPDTGNLVISVRLPTPQRAARAADVLARQVVQFAQDDQRLLTVRLIARADVPTAPAGPSRRLIEAAGLIVGLLAGVGFAALIERLASSAQARQRPLLDPLTPVIGRLPWSRALRLEPMEAVQDPSVGQAAVDLLVQVEHEVTRRSMEVLVVTSAMANEGKTTVAKLLATLLAIGSDSVLLVDAHMKNPALSKGLEPTNGNGLRDVLTGNGRIEDYMQQSWSERLWLLTSSYDPNGNGVSRRRLIQLVHEARKRFGLVVFDTGSLLHDDLARELVTIADGVLLVTSAESSLGEAEAAVAALRSIPSLFVGLIVNGSDGSPGIVRRALPIMPSEET
jgi:Mrp family chromosome partitioning ATPase/capsular polysaccharide biosynthesis protein